MGTMFLPSQIKQYRIEHIRIIMSNKILSDHPLLKNLKRGKVNKINIDPIIISLCKIDSLLLKIFRGDDGWYDDRYIPQHPQSIPFRNDFRGHWYDPPRRTDYQRQPPFFSGGSVQIRAGGRSKRGSRGERRLRQKKKKAVVGAGIFIPSSSSLRNDELFVLDRGLKHAPTKPLDKF